MNREFQRKSEVTVEEMISYLQGKLSEEDRLRIDRQMKEDPLLVESLSELDSFLKRGGDPALAVERRNAFKKNFKSAGTSRKWNLFPVAAVFALLIIGIASVIIILNSGNRDLYSEYYKPYKDILTTRGEHDEQMTLAMNYYNSGDYSNAEIVFLEITESANQPGFSGFYLAQSQMAQGKYGIAIENLKRLSEYEYPMQSHAQWYIALAYLKLNQKQEALMYLNKIIKSEESYNKPKAIELSEKLKKN